MPRLVIGLIAAVTLLGLVGPATSGSLGQHSDRYTADLTWREAVPRPSRARKSGIGQFDGVYNKDTRVLVWILRYGALSGTGRATAADIQVGKKGKTGPVLVHLCSPCLNPSGGTMRLTLDQGLVFEKQELYVNVRTGRNRAGEIRGQLASIELTEGCAPC